MTDRLHFILRVEEMSCEGCAQHIKQALQGMPSVESAEVIDWREGSAAVAAAGTVTVEALVEAVAKTGYRAVVQCEAVARKEESRRLERSAPISIC